MSFFQENGRREDSHKNLQSDNYRKQSKNFTNIVLWFCSKCCKDFFLISTFESRNKEISNFTRELFQLDTSILQTSHVKLSVSTRVIIAQNTHILRILQVYFVHMKLLHLYIKQIANLDYAHSIHPRHCLAENIARKLGQNHTFLGHFQLISLVH